MLASFGLTRRGMAAWVEHESEPESEALPLTTKDRVDASSAPASVREALGWGALAECTISVCCPLVMRGEVNVTATALNLLGPLLGGMARALDEQSGDSAVRRSCAAFQTGFIGVITSFSFMVDQGAQLADDPLRGDLRHGWLYIGTMLAAGCGCFVLGRALLGALLRTRRGRRLLLRAARPVTTADRRSLGWQWVVVCLIWIWVVLAPPGAVFDPQQVRAAREAAGQQPLTTPLEPASKSTDLAHLLCGMGMQAVGLALSARIGNGTSSLGSRGVEVYWGALLCNTLACLLLVTLRVGEAAALLTEHSLLVTKLRTSCCGALSICGGLSALVVAGQGRHEASGRKDRPPPRHAMRALVNLGLHAYVALAVCAVLPGMTTLGFEYTRSSRPVGS